MVRWCEIVAQSKEVFKGQAFGASASVFVAKVIREMNENTFQRHDSGMDRMEKMDSCRFMPRRRVLSADDVVMCELTIFYSAVPLTDRWRAQTRCSFFTTVSVS